MTTETDAITPQQPIELAIGGMTCASCAARIEKRLNKLDGVTATVNYATEQAKVVVSNGATPEEVIAQVEAAGYTARLPLAATTGAEGGDRFNDANDDDDPVRGLRTRLMISTWLTIPVVALAMVPALQFDSWQWLSLTLAAPVVVWGAAPFHRAAWTNARTPRPPWTR